MSYLRFPPANPFGFYSSKKSGAINQNVSLDADYEYTEDKMEAHYNCTGLHYAEPFCQPFNCNDITAFQFVHDRDGYAPTWEVYDSTGVLVGYLPTTYIGSEADTGYGVYQTEVDFSDTGVFTCDGCYDFKLNSLALSNSQSTCWADPNPVWTAGGSNIASANLNLAYVRTGVDSILITAPISPVAIDRTIGYCSGGGAMTFAADTIYKVTIWIYERSDSTPFSASDDPYRWDITRDLSDATIIYEKLASTPNADAYDTWHEVTTIFKTGSDTTGNIYLTTDNTPNAAGGGFVYLDDLTLDANPTSLETKEEAFSQQICLATSHDCTIGITYSADNNAFGLVYEDTYYGTTFAPFVRVPGTYHQFKLDDPSHETDEDSSRTTTAVISATQKIRTMRTGTMPEYMLETVGLAVKHNNVALNGVDYICVTGSIAPEWDSEAVTTATMEIDLRLKDYENQLSSC